MTYLLVVGMLIGIGIILAPIMLYAIAAIVYGIVYVLGMGVRRILKM